MALGIIVGFVLGWLVGAGRAKARALERVAIEAACAEGEYQRGLDDALRTIDPEAYARWVARLNA